MTANTTLPSRLPYLILIFVCFLIISGNLAAQTPEVYAKRGHSKFKVYDSSNNLVINRSVKASLIGGILTLEDPLSTDTTLTQTLANFAVMTIDFQDGFLSQLTKLKIDENNSDIRLRQYHKMRNGNWAYRGFSGFFKFEKAQNGYRIGHFEVKMRKSAIPTFNHNPRWGQEITVEGTFNVKEDEQTK